LQIRYILDVDGAGGQRIFVSECRDLAAKQAANGGLPTFIGLPVQGCVVAAAYDYAVD
jgi:hypothetical protein